MSKRGGTKTKSRARSRVRGKTAGAAAAVATTMPLALRRVRGKWDAASNSPDFRKHWGEADLLSPNAALTPAVMSILRKRARYEVANNSYAKGIVQSLANDMVGTGPRLQVPSGANGISREDSRRVERIFAAWAKAIDLPGKLRQMRSARAASGECFALFVTNHAVRHDVKLDLRLVESDQVASPYGLPASPGEVDGIDYDEYGNPKSYSILKAHPGSGDAAAFSADKVDAKNVIHYFLAARPGQHRGVPDITPALPLFSLLRRYTLASVIAAESAANLALVAYTTSMARGDDDTEEQELLSPWSTFELERNAMTALPEGYQLGQVDAKHPMSTYDMVKRELIKEIGRCIDMPYAIAAGDSSAYNYSSGRLDHQTYDRAISIERKVAEYTILDRIFDAFITEASRITGLLLQVWRVERGRPTHSWFWQNRPHVDPQKEETALGLRIKNRTTTLADEWAQSGEDWEEKLEQQKLEHASYRKAGLVSPYDAGMPTPAVPQTEETVPVAEES